MKRFLPIISLLFCSNLFAQQQSFDLATYTPPKNWKKKTSANAVQFSIENKTTGTYCLVTLYKSVAATANPKNNFNLAWTSIVKEMVTVTATPQLQPSTTDKARLNDAVGQGWELQSGFAPFESNGNNGMALLVTSSGYNKMVTLLVLTNTSVYQKEVDGFIASVHLKKPVATKEKTNTATTTPAKPETSTAITKQTGFAFTTTNFDDGWTSTVQEDWVEVKKGNIKVLIHYPNKNADAYNSVLLDGLKNAWDVLVAPRYSSASNFEFKPLTGWQSIEFAEADMVEKGTNKTVHVVLFKMNYSNGSGKYLEFITPNKSTFENEFGPYHQTTYGWEKMEAMANYNKFAVAAGDLTGKWTNDFSGMTQYVNAYTGRDAGANTHASNQSFEFSAGNTYKWDLGVASGFVGNIKFQSAKATGKFTMVNNWQVNFSDIEGKPKTYNIQFVCIKGARLLWIGETGFGRKD